jgi:hypothetical protein
VHRPRQRHRPGLDHPVPALALAVAEHRHIDGDEQRAEALRLGALDQVLDPRAIAEGIELEPVILLRPIGELLERIAAGAAQAQPRPRRLGSARDRDIAGIMAQAGRAGWRKAERQRQHLPGDLRLQLGLGDAGQDLLAQPPAAEAGHVLTHRDEIVGAAIDIGPGEIGQPLARLLAPHLDVERLDAVAQFELHRCHDYPLPIADHVRRLSASRTLLRKGGSVKRLAGVRRRG